MTEERKHAILLSATFLAARKLAEIGDKPCPAREAITTGDMLNPESLTRTDKTGLLFHWLLADRACTFAIL